MRRTSRKWRKIRLRSRLAVSKTSALLGSLLLITTICKFKSMILNLIRKSKVHRPPHSSSWNLRYMRRELLFYKVNVKTSPATEETRFWKTFARIQGVKRQEIAICFGISTAQWVIRFSILDAKEIVMENLVQKTRQKGHILDWIERNQGARAQGTKKGKKAVAGEKLHRKRFSVKIKYGLEKNKTKK